MSNQFTKSWLLNETVGRLRADGWWVAFISSTILPVDAICFKPDRVLLLNVRLAHERPSRMQGGVLVSLVRFTGPHLHYVVIKDEKDIETICKGGTT